mgnify:FL=1
MAKHKGKQSMEFEKNISIISTASTVGTKEGEGPLKSYFDVILTDNLVGQKSWEKAESKIASDNLKLAINKAGLNPADINYVITGDLLNQCCGSTFGVRSLNIPFFGVFGACSTMGESMSLGAILLDGGGAKYVLCGASSHFASAEKQFRFPMDLGTQRTPTASWTVTGDGAALLSIQDKPPYIKRITTGKILDMGITDANNMGAAMAPAAADAIYQHFCDFNFEPNYYDVIVTGDLGYIGSELLINLLKEKGIDISKNHKDCGIEIFDKDKQDTHCGGSGCACSAVTFAGYFYNKLNKKEINKVLFVPTGALMSPTSVQQGESIAGIAHCVSIEN